MKLVSLRAKNYRTLQSLELDFDPSFVAICGANDSGKTNVIRVLRCILREEAPSYQAFWETHELSIKHDWPKWLNQEAGSAEISLTLDLSRDQDAGLYQFVLRQFGKEIDDATLRIQVNIRQDHGQKGRTVSISFGGQKFVGIEADDVLGKIQASKTVFFHNSTQAISATPFSRGLGRLRELSADVGDVEKIQVAVRRGLKKIARARQEEIEALLGRLGNKYKVGLSVPVLDVSEMPFDITLEESKAVVPLDDWGSGTRNRTLILFLMFAARQAQTMAESADKVAPIIVIEEPECFLHPVAQAEFGRLLQELAEELGVQVILTTHSPYMLSTARPESNILLDRRIHYKKRLETERVDTGGENWMAPFARALGMDAELFAPWRELFLLQSDCVLLVEGELDKEYLTLLRDSVHTANAIKLDGNIVSYEGTGQLGNAVMLRLIRNRCRRLVVTYDLDAESQVACRLESAGLVKNRDYLAIGLDEPGKRCVEGLVPESIRAGVNGESPDLVAGLQSDDGRERKSAKSALKKAYLEKFKDVAKAGTDDFKEFYRLSRRINRALADDSDS